MQQPRVSQERERKLYLEAAVRARGRIVAQRAQDVVEQFDMRTGDFSPTSVRGLVNALGAGPGRLEVKERLDSLKFYLAWRIHRADEGEGWHRVANRITADLTRWESVATKLVQDIADHELGSMEDTDQDALALELHLRLAELYIATLVSYYEMGRAS